MREVQIIMMFSDFTVQSLKTLARYLCSATQLLTVLAWSHSGDTCFKSQLAASYPNPMPQDPS
jgi:hypothetical protein